MASGSGSKRAGVGQHLELDPACPAIAQPFQQLAAQPGGPQRILGRETAGRVGQDRVLSRIEVIEQVPPLLVKKPLAPHRDRDHFGAAGFEAIAHQLERAVLAGADKEPAAKRVRADLERLKRLCRRGAAADECDHFEHVSFGNGRLGVPRPGDQIFIQLDGDVLGLQPQVSHQLGDRKRPGQLLLFAVERDP